MKFTTEVKLCDVCWQDREEKVRKEIGNFKVKELSDYKNIQNWKKEFNQDQEDYWKNYRLVEEKYKTKCTLVTSGQGEKDIWVCESCLEEMLEQIQEKTMIKEFDRIKPVIEKQIEGWRPLLKNIHKITNIINIQWQSLDNNRSYQYAIELLANEIREAIQIENIQFDYICPIPNGGIIPASHLSQLIGIEYCPYSPYAPALEHFATLYVDDIVHSGKTINDLFNATTYNPSNKFIALAKNELFQDTNNLLWRYVFDISKTDWTQFPWELPMDQEDIEIITKKHLDRANNL